MSPEELTAASQALVNATNTAAIDAGNNVEAAQMQLAPGLTTGSNIPGGYNYQRNIAPTVPVLTANFLTTAKREVLRGAIRDAVYSAQNNFDTAKSSLAQRERNFRAQQAALARERQRKQDAQAAAALAANNRGQGLQVGGVNIKPKTAPKITFNTTNPQPAISPQNARGNIQGGSGSFLQGGSSIRLQ